MRFDKLFAEYFKFGVILIFIIFSFGCAGLRGSIKGDQPLDTNVTKAKRSGNVRVALFKNAKRVNLSSYRPVKVFDMLTRKPLGEIRLAEDTQIILRDGRLFINGQSIITPQIRFVAADGEFLSVSNKRYRGQVEVAVNEKDGGLLVVNYIPLEEYLLGVVPNEMISTWSQSALQAQAIASRTFALYKMSGSTQFPYDLDATVNSQVYGGLDTEKESTNQAVRQTEGQVAFYKGKYISAFYHSNCGGSTADVRDVWGNQTPYLQGTSCGFCDDGPHFNWQASIPKAETSACLRKNNISINNINQMELIGRDGSGRIKTIRIHHSEGSKDIKASVFRMLIGVDKIRSTKFYLRDEGSSILFVGKGWGHGVGLCQEGANSMSRSGFSCEDILKHYYPGIELRKVQFE